MVCAATVPMPASVCISLLRVVELLIAAGQRADFFFDEGKLAFEHGKMALKADAHGLQGRMVKPACLGLDHVLEFGAPSHQGAKRSLLRPRRLIKLQIGLVASVLGDQNSIDGIAFRVPASEFGISADA